MATATNGTGNGIDCRTHKFLLNTSNNETHPFTLALESVRIIRNMPETRATFRPKDIVDKIKERKGLDGENNEYHALMDRRMFEMEGSWELSEAYHDTHNYTRFVNPHYLHRHKFPEAIICKCGARVLRDSIRGREEKITGEANHKEDCKMSWRTQAKADVWRMRERVIRSCAILGIAGERARDRMAYHNSSIGNLTRGQNIDIDSLKEEYRQKRANTAAQLYMDGYSSDEIAEFYGVSKDFLRKTVNRRTPYDMWELYNERRSQ